MSNIERAKALAAKATKGRPDQRVATGGGSTPPAAGKAKLRFIGYVELGEQVELFEGRARVRDKVQLSFELVNRKKHPPIELEDGTKVPRRIKIDLTNSLSERATLFKLRKQMDPDDTKSHIAQMIGDGFLGRVFHHTFTAQGREVTVARLKPKGGDYRIEPPFEEDEDSGELTEINIGEAMSDILLFFWDDPTLEMWDSLFIEGEYEKGRSRNVIQHTLRRAVNWEGSPMYKLLEADDRDEDEYSPLEPTVQVPDEEDEAPAKDKPAKKAKPPVDDDEDDEPVKPKKSKKVVEEDDEDDEPVKPKKSKKVVEEDDDDEDDEPVKPKAKKVVEEDEEDEEEAPKAKTKPKVASKADRLASLLSNI